MIAKTHKHADEDKQAFSTSEITPEALSRADTSQLLQLQTQLLLGNDWGAITISKELLPITMHPLGNRSIRIDAVIPKDLHPGSQRAVSVWREFLRLAIALRLFPSKGGKIQKFSSVISILRVLSVFVRENVRTFDFGLWGEFNANDAQKLRGNQTKIYLLTVAYFHRIGALPAGPKSGHRKGPQPTRDRSGEPEHQAQVEDRREFQPLPDAYTAEAGWRALQMTRIVGPTLLDAIEGAISVNFRTTKSNGKRLCRDYLDSFARAARDPVIRNWDWRAPDGSSLSVLPMSFRLGIKAKSGYRVPWPPTTFADAWRLVSLLQQCHLWLISLALAARHSEVLSLEVGSIQRSHKSAPTSTFHTWKLDGVTGRAAEAPIPDVIVSAIYQQERLAAIVKSNYGQLGNNLWVRLGTGNFEKGGLPIESFAQPLMAFNAAFELDGHLEGTRLHMHRFRKTLSRIVALALVHAPKILMDVLGHRDEQMTVMHYVLADPGMLSEIEQVVRELVILKGVEAVTKPDELQGKAADKIRERVTQHAKLLGAQALEPQNMREFVEVLTEGGTGWAVVGPGKICTGFRVGGLCNRGSGKPNPHYCTPECSNQLLLPSYETTTGTIASAVLEAIETLDYMVEQLRAAQDEGEEVLIAQFAGQIRGLLHQWREVDNHFKARYSSDTRLSALIGDMEVTE